MLGLGHWMFWILKPEVKIGSLWMQMRRASKSTVICHQPQGMGCCCLSRKIVYRPFQEKEWSSQLGAKGGAGDPWWEPRAWLWCGCIYITNWGRLVKPKRKTILYLSLWHMLPPKFHGSLERGSKLYSGKIQTRTWSRPPTTTIRCQQSPSAGVCPSDVRI